MNKKLEVYLKQRKEELQVKYNEAVAEDNELLIAMLHGSLQEINLILSNFSKNK